MSKRLERSLLLLALLLAAALRLWQLAEMPPGLYHDEAYNGLDALALLEGKTFPQFYEGWELYAAEAHAGQPPLQMRWPLFFEGNYGREPAHIYLMAASIALLGPSPLAIRLVPAVAGILAILTTYLAAGALLRPRFPYAPLAAAFALALFFPAIHFSRFGLRAMLFVPVETATVYLFWKGLARWQESAGWEDGQGRTLLLFAGAGFLLGLGIYVYAAARLFPLLFILFVLLWFGRERGAFRRYWPPIAMMAGIAVATAAPLLLYFARYPYFFVFRLAYVANRGRGTVPGRPALTWLLNVGRVVGGFFWQGETHLRHNLPGRPYLDPLQGFFFLLGLAAAARHWWRSRREPGTGPGPIGFLFLWLLLMLLPSVLSGDAPHFGRLTGAAPVVAICAGIGVDAFYRALRRETQDGQRAAGAAALLLAAFLLASLAFTVRDYFGSYAGHPDLARDFYLPEWRLGQYAAAQPADTVLYLTPTQAEMATLYFALGDPERLHSYNGGGSLLPAGRPGDPALYLVRPEAEAALAQLEDYFPEGRLDEDADVAAYPWHVPATAERLPDVIPTNQSFAGGLRLLGWQAVAEEGEVVVTLAWQGRVDLEHDYTAYVHLLDEQGEIVAQRDRPPAGYPTGDWRRGEIVVDRYRVPLPADLPPATYTVRSGFYDGESLRPLGEPALLGPVTVGS